VTSPNRRWRRHLVAFGTACRGLRPCQCRIDRSTPALHSRALVSSRAVAFSARRVPFNWSSIGLRLVGFPIPPLGVLEQHPLFPLHPAHHFGISTIMSGPGQSRVDTLRCSNSTADLSVRSCPSRWGYSDQRRPYHVMVSPHANWTTSRLLAPMSVQSSLGRQADNLAKSAGLEFG